MKQSTIRGWYLIHKWTSLSCTVFVLMLSLTGLPLIFHDEIDRWLAKDMQGVVVGPGSSGNDPTLLPLDTMLAKAVNARRGDVPLFMAFSNDSPMLTVTTGPGPEAMPADMTLQQFNRSTGAVVGAPGEGKLTRFLLQLHTDLFLGLWGELFLGAMGLAFVAAIVSGVVLYAPFMRKLDFGALRVSRSRRLKWLDYHNLLGIVALAWMIVVGLTGVVNSFATPIMKLWKVDELAAITLDYAGRDPLPPARYGSLDRAMVSARRAVPGYLPQFIAFPGGAFSSQHHYAIYFQGATPLTQRLLTTALIDAESGRVTDVRAMPWYVRALSLSQPLHFGDYGGLPMKLLWAALDVTVVIMLGSGVYLWIGRRHTSLDQRVHEVERGGAWPTGSR